ncbi:Alpha/Beta hydrolase protein [Xylariales sp. AK1849]|nr:Alpha/Beta hydrolase protein [Xylariales sp. AK1849]
MTRTTFITALLELLASTVIARQCTDLNVTVAITSRNGKFYVEPPTDNTEVTNLALNLARPGHNYSQEVLVESITVSGTYSIAATYCEPDSGPGKALQVLTHGVGFDRSYWDFPFNNYNYSYVNAALTDDYSTFAYDRIGTAQSSTPGDPVNEIQSWLQISSLHALTLMLRAATLPGVSASYDKIFHVGHSFGSRQTYNLAATYAAENISDGIALTGFSQLAFLPPYNFLGSTFTFGANYVQANGLPQFENYPDGYVAFGDVSALQTDFFAPGQFDPAILEAAAGAAQPVSVGELLTLTSPAAVNSTFGAPVLIVTGDRDISACGGNCNINTTESIPEMSRKFFLDADIDFEVVLIPDAGHGLNLVNIARRIDNRKYI